MYTNIRAHSIYHQPPPPPVSSALGKLSLSDALMLFHAQITNPEPLQIRQNAGVDVSLKIREKVHTGAEREEMGCGEKGGS